jgi:hypothetical protein
VTNRKEGDKGKSEEFIVAEEGGSGGEERSFCLFLFSIITLSIATLMNCCGASFALGTGGVQCVPLWAPNRKEISSPEEQSSGEPTGYGV